METDHGPGRPATLLLIDDDPQNLFVLADCFL